MVLLTKGVTVAGQVTSQQDLKVSTSILRLAVTLGYLVAQQAAAFLDLARVLVVTYARSRMQDGMCQ